MPAATTEVHTVVNLRAYSGSITYELERDRQTLVSYEWKGERRTCIVEGR